MNSWQKSQSWLLLQYIPTSLMSFTPCIKKEEGLRSHSAVSHTGIQGVNSIWHSWEILFLHSALHWFLFSSKLPQLNLIITLTLDTIVGLHCRLVKGSICWFFMLWLSAWKRNSTWFCRVCYLHSLKSSHSPPSMQLLICYIQHQDQRKNSNNITDYKVFNPPIVLHLTGQYCPYCIQEKTGTQPSDS